MFEKHGLVQVNQKMDDVGAAGLAQVVIIPKALMFMAAVVHVFCSCSVTELHQYSNNVVTIFHCIFVWYFSFWWKNVPEPGKVRR